MKKLILLAVVACAAAPVWAQSANGGATFPLPPEVKQMVSIDAQNSLLMRVQNDASDPSTELQLLEVQHVYSGGIARLFGGAVLPSIMFLTPGNGSGYAGGAIAGGNQNGNFAGQGTGPNVSTAFNGNNNGTSNPYGGSNLLPRQVRTGG